MFFDLEQFADNTCLINDEQEAITYAELAHTTTAFEKVFASNPDSRALVLVLCDNNLESLAAYLASLRSDSVAMLLGANIDSSLLEEVTRAYSPHYIVAPATSPLLYGISGQRVLDCYNHCVTRLETAAPLSMHSDLALMLSTSGSTGSPKFVRLSKANIEANAKSIAQYLKLDSSERPITVLPMPYSYGLSIINSHLCVGAQLVLTEHSVMTKEFWKLFTELKVTSLSGVPYTYEMYKRLRIERRDLSHLRSMTQAGGKLDESLVKSFADLAAGEQFRFYVMYGQTEASARISYVPPEKLQEKCGSIGIAIPGGKLTLRNEYQAGIHTEGELVYKGPNVMMGYASNASDLSLPDELHGVLPTGDLGRFDEDGYCYVTGRLKRIIKMYGNRINLDDIDKHLTRLQVEGVCGGEDNELQVAMTDPKSLESVKQSLIDTFKFDHRSVRVFHVPEILRNKSGKIQYGKIFSQQPG